METYDARTDRPGAVAAAAAALRAGQLAVLPTDTVYGVAADAFAIQGTRRVFGAKRRSRSFPLPVLVRSPKQVLGLTPDVPEEADRLLAAFWPGPLTVVLRTEPELPWDLGDNRGTVAVRMPLDEVTLDVIREVGPIATTSANLSGQPPATTVAAAVRALGGAVAVYVDDGPRRGARPSTIVDLSRGEPLVLREGPVPAELALQVARGEVDPLDAAAELMIADDARAATRTEEADDDGGADPDRPPPGD